jgi:hypothetical protein
LFFEVLSAELRGRHFTLALTRRTYYIPLVFSKIFENVSVLLKRKKLKKYFLVKKNPKIHFQKPHDLNQKILKFLQRKSTNLNQESCFSKIYTSKKSLKRKNARYARAFLLIGRFCFSEINPNGKIRLTE